MTVETVRNPEVIDLNKMVYLSERMSGTDYSTSPIRFLYTPEPKEDIIEATQSAIRDALPGIRWCRADAVEIPDGQTSLLLIPISQSVDLAVAEMLYRNWIATGRGTIFQSLSGKWISRFIPVALNDRGTVPVSIRPFMDGNQHSVLCIGEINSEQRNCFSMLVNEWIRSADFRPPDQPDWSGLEAYIRGRFAAEFPTYPYHNLQHIEDVLQACLRIAQAENVGESDVQLLRIGALFHDAGFIHDSPMHEQHSADMAAGVMPAFGFNFNQIAKIRQMILATKVPQKPKTLLDSILCDADLDYLGREDFYTIGNRLYQELKEIGKVEDERSWNLLQHHFLSTHCYHTFYSMVNREPAKQDRIREIIAKLA